MLFRDPFLATSAQQRREPFVRFGERRTTQSRELEVLQGSVLALALQEEWVSEHPADTEAAQALAGAYSVQGKTAQASTEFEKLLDKDASNVVALNELAWLLREDQPTRALEYAMQANELQPDSPALMDTLAVALYHNGEFRRARQVMQKALTLAPRHPSLRFHEAMIDAALGDTNRAVGTLHSILADDVEFTEKQDAMELLAKLQL